MQTIQAYLYPNKVEVQILDTTITNVRNRQVYSRPIKIYQGIDNPIQIVVKNQDQNSVDLSGSSVRVDIQDFNNNVTVQSYTVNFDANVGGNVQRGIGSITIQANTVNAIEQRFYKLVTRTVTNGNSAPMYIDDNYGAILDLEVLPGFLTANV